VKAAEAMSLTTATSPARCREPGLSLGGTVGGNYTNVALYSAWPFLFSPLRINLLTVTELAIFSLISNLLLWYLLAFGGLSLAGYGRLSAKA